MGHRPQEVRSGHCKGAGAAAAFLPHPVLLPGDDHLEVRPRGIDGIASRRPGAPMDFACTHPWGKTVQRVHINTAGQTILRTHTYVTGKLCHGHTYVTANYVTDTHMHDGQTMSCAHICDGQTMSCVMTMACVTHMRDLQTMSCAHMCDGQTFWWK